MNKKLVLGTVQMGMPYGINNAVGHIPLRHSLAILKYAHDNGIEILDTAEAYGNAHSVIGKYHELNPTKKFKVMTKLPHMGNANVVEKVRDYLYELNVDHLEALLFHSFSGYKDHLDSINELKALSTVKNLGVSVYTNAQMEEVILDDRIAIIQVPFNLLDNNNLRGQVFGKAKARGKMIHTRSALLQGLFFKDTSDPNGTVQRLGQHLLWFANLAKEHGIPISSLALKYCLDQKNIDNVLIGVDSLDQLKDNLNATSYKLAKEVLDKIESVRVENTDLLNPSLWN